MGKVRVLAGAVVLCGGSVMAGCGPDVVDTDAQYGDRSPTKMVSNKITGSVSEWVVDVRVKTDFEPGKIPLGDNNRFDEKLAGLEVVDEIPEWEPGKTGTLKLKLDPGKYQLLCNIAGHYKNGMYTPLIVTE